MIQIFLEEVNCPVCKEKTRELYNSKCQQCDKKEKEE